MRQQNGDPCFVSAERHLHICSFEQRVIFGFDCTVIILSVGSTSDCSYLNSSLEHGFTVMMDHGAEYIAPACNLGGHCFIVVRAPLAAATRSPRRFAIASLWSEYHPSIGHGNFITTVMCTFPFEDEQRACLSQEPCKLGVLALLPWQHCACTLYRSAGMSQ